MSSPETLERRLVQAIQASEELRARLAKAEATVRAQRLQIREATQTAERAEAWVRTLLGSTSWRVTAPLRAAKACALAVMSAVRGRLRPHGDRGRPAREELSPVERELYDELRSVVPAGAAPAGPGPAFGRQVIDWIADRPQVSPGSTSARLRLALVLPRPQARVEVPRLLPLLSERYAVELMVDETEPDDAATFGLPVRDWSWFEAQGQTFDRALYRFADDPTHARMFGLLRRHPGVVLLHDFFLTRAAAADRAPGRLQRAIFEAHGLTGLLALSAVGIDEALSSFPLNKSILDHALGVLVDSERSLQLAADWYGARAAGDWRVVPEPISTVWLGEAIEQFSLDGERAQFRRLIDSVLETAGRVRPADGELVEAARALAKSRPPSCQRQLLVDISAIVRSPLRTGIPRVVRSVMMGLIAAPPAGWRVEPVYFDEDRKEYRYAREFGLALVDGTALELPDSPLDLGADDIFLGLDVSTIGADRYRVGLAPMAERGVRVYFVVYDLLPLLSPAFFPPGTERQHAEYLQTIASISDGLVAISRSVADELVRWTQENVRGRRSPLRIGYFHPGSDIDGSLPSFGLPPDAGELLEAMRARPSFLMVGTLEPRKGHAQALDALELLWRGGVEANLVIAGGKGWMVERLSERLRVHPELGRRLFWLSGASDEMLRQLYGQASALLAASEGEGFGLPLIEAARHGLPIVARSLPVFREVAGEHAYYFSSRSAEEMAAALSDWLALRREGREPRSTALPRLDWSQSIQKLLDVVERGHWYAEVRGSQFLGP